MLPDFLALEEGSTTNPLSYFESGTGTDDQSCINFTRLEHHNDHRVASKMHGVSINLIETAEQQHLNFLHTPTLQSLVKSYDDESTAKDSRDWNYQCYTISFEKNDKVVYPSTNFITSARAATTNRKRIRWTQNLHSQFIECVNRLGGAKSSETITDTCSMAELDPKMGMEMVEALRLQLEVQRHLYEQLECQRKLQLQIEEQAKQLKKMFDSREEKLPI
ncbi:hypothetical protein ACH5RR_000666 [Cinchona calisaya]|uniref:MYB-CC type transcription factor LHEQLE-containing domain-containing protein n=1 Tax=Cinchona calisaya TaxID=153742 RepID=A0ABD3B1A1_9GENT